MSLDFRGAAFVKHSCFVACSDLRQHAAGGLFVEHVGNIVVGSEAYFVREGACFYMSYVVYFSAELGDWGDVQCRSFLMCLVG